MQHRLYTIRYATRAAYAIIVYRTNDEIINNEMV